MIYLLNATAQTWIDHCKTDFDSGSGSGTYLHGQLQPLAS